MTGQRAELIAATQMDLMAMGAAIEGGCAPQLAATGHEKMMTMATDLFARMLADPPKLTNGERLDAHLARVSELSRDQSAVVLNEYLRFLALAAAGPDMAVPSPLIDAVWHKHIEDTRAYGDYCMRVIGRFVHHMPNLESQRDHPGYPRTLESYSNVFEMDPDPRVWPSVERLKKIQGNIYLEGPAAILAALGVFLMIFGGDTAAKVAGLAVTLASAALLIYITFSSQGGYWRLGKRSDGSCASSSGGCASDGGGGDGGGCGGGGGD